MTKKKQSGTIPFKTFGDVADHFFASHEFKALAPATQRLYRRSRTTLDLCNYGIEVVSANIVRNTLHGKKPGIRYQAISFAKRVGSYAVKRGWLEANQFATLERPKLGEWQAWTMDEVYEVARSAHNKAQMMIFLAAFTGQRLSDLLNLEIPKELQHKRPLDTRAAQEDVARRGVIFTFKQQKTGEVVCVPVSAGVLALWGKKMKANLSIWALPYTNESYAWWTTAQLFHNRQTHVFDDYASTNDFYTDFYQALSRTTIAKPFHGIRKTCAAMLADSGCTTHEIAAVTGHKTLAMVQKYAKTANQKRLASSAMNKAITALNAEHMESHNG